MHGIPVQTELKRHEFRKGFTLIELAFVLVIVGLLLSVGAQMLPMLVKQSKLKENRITVSQVKSAIVGYAMANGRLPRASNNTANGTEINNCYRGYLPWAALGIPGNDAYTKTLYYAVDQYLTSSASVDQFKARLMEISNGTHVSTLTCNGTTYREAFVVFSAGENKRADSPNDDSGDGNLTQAADNTRFEDPDRPLSSNYDDILQAEEINKFIGLFFP